jgi:hypothetical protein
VAVGGLAPPAVGPDGAVGLPDWALAIVTPPTSAAVANRVLASVLIEAPPFPSLLSPSRHFKSENYLEFLPFGPKFGLVARVLP